MDNAAFLIHTRMNRRRGNGMFSFTEHKHIGVAISKEETVIQVVSAIKGMNPEDNPVDFNIPSNGDYGFKVSVCPDKNNPNIRFEVFADPIKIF